MAAQAVRSAPEAVKPSMRPHRRDAPRMAELLCGRHGEAKARKLAEREQKRARQARSRKQFEFWASVGVEMELRRETAPDYRDAEQVRLAQKSGEAIAIEISEGKASE